MHQISMTRYHIDVVKVLPLAKNMELAHLKDVQLGFYLALNKLIKHKLQSIFYLIPEHSTFIKYSLNKLN